MFIIDRNVVVDKKTNWSPDEKVNGMKFASITKQYAGKYKGAALVAMYLESFRYRLKKCEQLSSEIVESSIYDDSDTVDSMMQKAISNNLIKNSSIHHCNDILTLKWFMHEYKQCLVELKHTTITENPENFDIITGGLEIDDGKSIGYMMYGYDSEWVMLQGVNGIENGFGGFYRMKWDLFQSLFIQGSVFGLPLKERQISTRVNEYEQCLTFTAQEEGSIIRLVKTNASSAPQLSLVYSIDNGITWQDFIQGSSRTTSDGTIITLSNVGDRIMIKANQPNSLIGKSILYSNIFVMTGKISASGNIMSLLDGDNFASMTSLNGRNYVFYNLFSGCTALTRSPKLPATELSTYCYGRMFSGCTSLEVPPFLPAKQLNNSCYMQMFNGCTSLKLSPVLNAVTLYSSCYSSMFKDCTSLVHAPELPATTLTTSCYSNMFSGCTNLTSIKIGYTGTFSTTYFSEWLKDVAPTGTFYYNGTSTTRGISAIPEEWNIVRY